jgi:hypothetical protein
MWILLPEEHIIDAYLSRRDRPDPSFKKSFPERTYNYTFIPARDLHAFEIRRCNEVMECTQIAGPDTFSSYYHPFDDFPTITSHIHPHFVICNIGLKMSNTSNVLAFLVANAIGAKNETVIEKAIKVFRKWTEDIPVDSGFYHDHLPTGRDGDDNNSTCTKEGRMDTRAFCQSLHKRAPPTSPSNKSSHSRKRARAGPEDSNVTWLDDETLRMLDEDASPKKRWKRKRESVSAWVSTICSMPFGTC